MQKGTHVMKMSQLSNEDMGFGT